MKCKKILCCGAFSMILSAPIALNITSCTSNNETIEISKINFDHNKYVNIFLGTKQGQNQRQLYAIDRDDQINEVNCYYRSSKSKAAQYGPVKPITYFDFSDDFYFFVYNKEISKNNEKPNAFNYLVNKKTGECFKFPKNIFPITEISNSRNIASCGFETIFPQDKFGYTYCLCNAYNDANQLSKGIYRLNLDNLNNIQYEKVSEGNDEICQSFGVSAEGDVAYSYKQGNEIKYKCVNHYGKIIKDFVGGETEFWSNPDGKIFCLSNDGDDGKDKIQYLNIDQQNVNLGCYDRFSEHSEWSHSETFNGYEGFDSIEALCVMTKDDAYKVCPWVMAIWKGGNTGVALYLDKQTFPKFWIMDMPISKLFDIVFKNYYAYGPIVGVANKNGDGSITDYSFSLWNKGPGWFTLNIDKKALDGEIPYSAAVDIDSVPTRDRKWYFLTYNVTSNTTTIRWVYITDRIIGGQGVIEQKFDGKIELLEDLLTIQQ